MGPKERSLEKLARKKKRMEEETQMTGSLNKKDLHRWVEK